jgi:hypothetical protein
MYIAFWISYLVYRFKQNNGTEFLFQDPEMQIIDNMDWVDDVSDPHCRNFISLLGAQNNKIDVYPRTNFFQDLKRFGLHLDSNVLKTQTNLNQNELDKRTVNNSKIFYHHKLQICTYSNMRRRAFLFSSWNWKSEMRNKYFSPVLNWMKKKHNLENENWSYSWIPAFLLSKNHRNPAFSAEKRSYFFNRILVERNIVEVNLTSKYRVIFLCITKITWWV